MVVKITFRSAKVIMVKKVPNKTGHDVLFDMKSLCSGAVLRNRDGDDYRALTDSDKVIEHPFGVEQVSNLLHVLLGQRPVPSIQGSVRKRLSFIDEIAATAKYQIDNVYHYASKKTDKKKMVFGFSKGRKVMQNSNRKGMKTVDGEGNVYSNIVVNWNMLRWKLCFNKPEVYEQVMSKFEELYGSKDFEKYPLVDLIRHLADEKGKSQELREFFTKVGLTSLAHVVNKSKDCVGFNQCSPYNGYERGLAQRVTNSSLLFKVSLDGSIWVDVPDQYLGLLFSGKRVATFLDGGYAQVDRVCLNSLELLNEAVTPISLFQNEKKICI